MVAASTGLTAQMQDQGGEMKTRSAQGKGGEAGPEAIAPIMEAQGSPQVG